MRDPNSRKVPSNYLKIDNLVDKGANYFSLPLSEIGLDIFKNSLSGLLGYGDNCNTRLSARLNDAGSFGSFARC